MITTRRNERVDNSCEQRTGGIDLLERKVPETYNEFVGTTESTEDAMQAKARMQENLEKLLNYDRYSATVEETKEEVVDTAQVVEDVAVSTDEDIRPTSTTMQFGDDFDQVYNDMNKQNEETEGKYHLTGKGKFIVFLYGLAVSVILALIVLNTGVLASLYKSNAQNEAILNEKISIYNQINEEIETISSDEYVRSIAEKQLNMIEG